MKPPRPFRKTEVYEGMCICGEPFSTTEREGTCSKCGRTQVHGGPQKETKQVEDQKEEKQEKLKINKEAVNNPPEVCVSCKAPRIGVQENHVIFSCGSTLYKDKWEHPQCQKTQGKENG